MLNQLLPEIGSSGAFKFKAPFDKILGASTNYTCKSIRKISELLSKSEPVLNTYYLAYGLTSDDYSIDLSLDTSIIGLFSGKGVWFYVPASYILSYPDSTGIGYRRMIMGAELGPVPDTMDLEPINQAVADTIYGYMGIRPVVKNVVVSQKILVSQEDHQSIEIARTAKQTVEKPLSFIIDELTQQRDTAYLKITELETYIKNNLL